MSEESFTLTPKGWLFARLMPHYNEQQINDIWEDLTAFVSKQAKSNGMPDGGIPCLVLEGGGHCITAERSRK